MKISLDKIAILIFILYLILFFYMLLLLNHFDKDNADFFCVLSDYQKTTFIIKNFVPHVLLVLFTFFIYYRFRKSLTNISDLLQKINKQNIVGNSSRITEIQAIYDKISRLSFDLQTYTNKNDLIKRSLKQQNKLVANLLDYLVIGINYNLDIKIWNKVASEFFDMSYESAMKSNLKDILAEDLLAFHTKLISSFKYIEPNTPIVVNKKIVVKGFPCTISVYKVETDLLIAFIRKIEPLLERNYYDIMFKVIDNSDIVLVTIDTKDLSVVTISESVANLLGYTKKEFLNKTVSFIDLIQDNFEAFKSSLNLLTCRESNTKKLEFNLSLYDKFNNTIYVTTAFYTSELKGKSSRYIQGVIRNITPQVENEILLKTYNDELTRKVQEKTEEIQLLNSYLIDSHKLTNKNLQLIAESECDD